MTVRQVREIVDELFEQEALAIGGLIAVEDLDDDLVWRLIRTLDAIRSKALRRLDDGTEGRTEPERDLAVRPHPAVEEFLRSLRRG